MRFARFIFSDSSDIKTKEPPASWPPKYLTSCSSIYCDSYLTSSFPLQIIKLLYFCFLLSCRSADFFYRTPSQFCIQFNGPAALNTCSHPLGEMSGFRPDRLGPLTLTLKSQPGNTHTSLLGVPHMLLQFSITVTLY